MTVLVIFTKSTSHKKYSFKNILSDCKGALILLNSKTPNYNLLPVKSFINLNIYFVLPGRKKPVFTIFFCIPQINRFLKIKAAYWMKS